MNAPRVVVMGVSGCGKSTVGRELAQALGVTFVEGDTLHSARNVERMAAGIALTDADRRDWLHAVAGRLADAAAGQCGVVVACSALKRSYRDLLRAAAPGVRFVHLRADRALLESRLAGRVGHYMPASLLQSQLDTLETPHADEQAIELDATTTPARLAAQAMTRLTGSPT